jgi:hypothetical protein
MIAIKSHLSTAELEHRYKTASESIAKSHFHALWLLTRGYSIDQVAGLLSFSARWVRILIATTRADLTVSAINARTMEPKRKF